MRAEGTLAILTGVFAAKGLVQASRVIAGPPERSLAAIKAVANRVARETKTMKASPGLNGQAVAARSAKVSARPAAPVATVTQGAPAPLIAKPAGGGTFKRTYQTGPKAGITEYVTRRS
jgi:hypothetical protein